MRINPSRRPPSYQSRRFQRRLLMMVGALALVLVAVTAARDPALWVFFARGGRPGGAEQKKPINFEVRLDEDEPLKPGEFRSPPSIARRKPVETAEAAEAELPGAKDAGSAAGERSPAAPDESLSTEIDRSWLGGIRDSTIGVRRDETEAFYAILSKARDIPQSRLESDSLGKTDFRVLMNDSETLRGRLVTVEGELKRLLPFEADANEFGLTQLYQAWLITDEEPRDPVRIVFSDKPDGLPEGEEISKVRVRATGYFFKREGYASQGGLHVAPLILARRLKPMQTVIVPGPPPVPAYLAPAILGVALSTAAIFGVMVWRFSRGDRTFQRQRRQRLLDEQAKAGPALNNLVAVDPGELLRQLAEDERRAESEEDAWEE